MKVISVKKEQILIVIYLLVIVVGLFSAVRSETVATFAMPVSKKVILIDPGHGGWDPGKVSGNTILEKDINLQIAQKLQTYLEQGGSYVIMTRIEDEALGSQKSSDMTSRKHIANGSQADLFVSIHQNAYSSSSVSGAQVFYFENSEKSKLLAQCIQTEIKNFLGQKNKLDAKSNSNYYVLKQTVLPAVIVECGFLTNPSDRHKLTQEEYQEKMAWSIYLGIIRYFENEPELAKAKE